MGLNCLRIVTYSYNIIHCIYTSQWVSLRRQHEFLAIERGVFKFENAKLRMVGRIFLQGYVLTKFLEP